MLLTATTGKGPGGNGSELEKVIPITRKPGADPKVVMSLGDLPDAAPGDRLAVTAELELTTDCKHRDQGDCVHDPYEYAPEISARLLLCDGPRTTGSSTGRCAHLADARIEVCTHDQHHKMFVFATEPFVIPPQGLGWLGPKACVNFVVHAHHPAAGPTDVILVGENDPGPAGPGGIVKGDKGRINAARKRAECPVGESLDSDRLEERTVPIETGKKVVALSRSIGRLREDEQLIIDATLKTDVGHIGKWTRVSTRLLLTDGPAETEARKTSEAARVAPFSGEVSEHNGTNSKGVAVARKVGVVRALRDARENLCVNLVVDAGNPLGGPTGEHVKLLEGLLRVRRFGPELCG